MAWPRKLNICGKPYTVKYFKTMSSVDPAGEEMLWGHHSGTHREIRIYSDCSDEDRMDTLLHEAVHAVFEQRPALKALVENEEAFVSDFATAWTDFIFRNKLG